MKTVSWTDNAGPSEAAMRLTVLLVWGLRIARGLALLLLNSRYAACVLAQSAHASLIGETGDLASCCAVLTNRRSKRLSDRLTPSSSSLTQFTSCVPASMTA